MARTISHSTTVNIGDIAKQITVTINVKGAKLQAWRFFVAAFFFKLGAAIAGINVELER